MAKNNTKLNRREFIKNTALVSGGVVLLPTLLTSCDDDGELPGLPGTDGFSEGVASFDPSQTSVILWTRHASRLGEAVTVEIRWELA